MLEADEAIVLSTLLAFAVTSLILAAFWSNNRNIPALRTLLLSCVIGGFGVFLAVGFESEPGPSRIAISYLMTIMCHGFAWHGFARFWQANSRYSSLIIAATGLATLISVAYYMAQGGGAEGRVAIASVYFAFCSFAIIALVLKASRANSTLYRGAITQSQVGARTIIGLFLVHGLFCVYRIFTGINVDDMSSVSASGGQTEILYSILEALAFAPVFVLGVVMMVAERLQTELRIEQMLDPISKGLNRRAFLTVSKTMLARARRNHEPVSLLMVEVTNFRDVRKQFQRSDADKLIVQMSDDIFADRREQDLFCRYSNDEFFLMLPGTPEAGAEQVRTRVDKNIRCMFQPEKGAVVKLAVRMDVITARGDDLDVDGMIDGVAKSLMAPEQKQKG